MQWTRVSELRPLTRRFLSSGFGVSERGSACGNRPGQAIEVVEVARSAFGFRNVTNHRSHSGPLRESLECRAGPVTG